jgi:hypothetical protein
MSFADTLLPLAEGLIDDTFGTPILYQRVIHGGYSPETGQVTSSTVDRQIMAAVLSTGRTEQGGTAEQRELRLWVHHGATGLQIFPLTSDRVQYLGIWWKVTAVEPTYSGQALVASKLTLERESG